MESKTLSVDLVEVEHPVPLDTEVFSQFINWKYPKSGRFDKNQYGYIFIYNKGIFTRKGTY